MYYSGRITEVYIPETKIETVLNIRYKKSKNFYTFKSLIIKQYGLINIDILHIKFKGKR